MSFHNFALAFDWNSASTGIDSMTGLPKHPLQIGLETVGILDSYTFVGVIDHVCFDAVNLTSDAQQSTHSIQGGHITFVSDNGSPFNLDEMTISNIGPASATLAAPLFGNGQYPCWSVVPLLQIAAKEGTFNFAVRLIVSGPDGLGGTMRKTFFHDPEMIIESAG